MTKITSTTLIALLAFSGLTQAYTKITKTMEFNGFPEGSTITCYESDGHAHSTVCQALNYQAIPVVEKKRFNFTLTCKSKSYCFDEVNLTVNAKEKSCQVVFRLSLDGRARWHEYLAGNCHFTNGKVWVFNPK